MTLRKWLSSSPALLQSIPEELREKDGSTLNVPSGGCPKTLGLHWNTVSDSMHVHMPNLSCLQVPTKRDVATAIGKTYDVLGWFSPSTIQIKVLLQMLWKEARGGLGRRCTCRLDANLEEVESRTTSTS